MTKKLSTAAAGRVARTAAPVALLVTLVSGLACGLDVARAAGPGAPPPSDAPFVLTGPSRTAPFPAADGRTIYEHLCQACHMPGGKGAAMGPAAYPALAGNARLAAKLYPAMLVVNGQGAMPSFGALLDDGQVAAVVNYVRGNFGNAFPDRVAPADVASLRPGMQAVPATARGR